MPPDDEPKRGRDGRTMHPASLANLKPGVHPWQPGTAPALVHGARSRRPQASPEWSPAVELCIGDLERIVDATLRDERGELQPWALPSVEAVAIQRVACQRLDRYVATQDAKGALTPDDVVKQSKVGESYHRALEREALTLRSRIDAQVQARDLVRDWSAATAEEDGRGE